MGEDGGTVAPGAEAPDAPDAVRPGDRRPASRRAWGPIALAAAILIAVGTVATVRVASAPRPVATLHQIGETADVEMLDILVREGPGEIDPASLRSYGSYRGVEVWSATNSFGAPCLLTLDRSGGDVPGASCVPEPAKLYADIMGYGLPDGGRARFVYRGNTVDVFEYQPEAAG
ncbi:hypothetical protein [Microbacterium sp. SS28]|uniref:hypothetical protein n=1 Tax=Microbacterium sp. SS28 TaxID=2919948 RepID=UPI001FAAF790|nr:hypothetical protein [Microbacterium sp. SS28]